MRNATRRALLSTGLALVLGCAGASWEQVRIEDTPAAYRRYLADHPRSPHAAEARERLAVLQFEREPTLDALERFRSEHPGSEAAAQLEQRLAEERFEAARVEGTPEAFEGFAATFPDGALAERALGNAAYLRAGGFPGRPDALAGFLRAHPSSDHAAEARRSLALLAMQRQQGFQRVALVFEIAPEIGDAERLRSVFAERVGDAYAAAGLSLVTEAPEAVLTIRHRENQAPDRDDKGRLAPTGILAETELILARTGEPEPIFQERLAQRVPESERRAGRSVLFAHSAAGYWEAFHVPVAHWPTQAARRPAVQPGMPLTAAAGGLGRVLALAPNGSLREVDVSDPAAARVVASYQRPGALARFAGVRRVGERVVLFGEEGLEILARDGASFRRVAAHDRGEVGAVAAVAEVDGRLLAAGTRGLVRLGLDGGPVKRLIDRPLRGMARSGDTLLVMDAQWLYGGDAHDPRPTRFFTVADFGRSLGAQALHVADGLAVVVGERGVVCFELRGPSPARPLAVAREPEVGRVADVAMLGSVVFLVGERGLQVLDPWSGRVVDGVDVAGRHALALAGTHVVAIGRERFELVDVAPWIATAAPAAPAP